jgi:hypothetical protein
VSPRLPFEPECAECERLRAAEEQARGEHDYSQAVDFRVLTRRHLRAAHGVEVVQ